MKCFKVDSLDEIINTYNCVIKIVDKNAKNSNDGRAYGGIIRSVKGSLQEYISEQIILNSWIRIGGDLNRIDINKKKMKVSIVDSYVNKLDTYLKNFIQQNKKDYFYKISVDKHIYIDNKFILGIECKAYTENAMLKRILVDFYLLKQLYNIKCYLFQLESQLTGDYSSLNKITYGSHSTHTLLSYFQEVDLKIVTFLLGERKVHQPIHKDKFFKRLEKYRLEEIILNMSSVLQEYL